MNWLLGGMTALSVGLIGSIGGMFVTGDTDLPTDFQLVAGTPAVVASDPSLSTSFELVAMTEDSPGPHIQPEPELSPWEIAQTAERPRRVLYFTRDNCPPCKAFIRESLPAMIGSGWIVGASPFAHIQVINADKEPAIAAAHNVSATPAYVRMVNGVAEAKHVGRLTVGQLAEFYKPSSKTKAEPKAETEPTKPGEQ